MIPQQLNGLPRIIAVTVIHAVHMGADMARRIMNIVIQARPDELRIS